MKEVKISKNNIMNFLFSPYGGYTKSVKKFYLQREGDRLFIIDKEDEESKIILSSEQRYMGDGRAFFMFKSSWIPIISVILMLLISIRYSFYLEGMSSIITFVYGATVGIFISSDLFLLYRKYTSGMAEAIKKDKKWVLGVATIPLLGGLLVAMGSMGMIELFSVVISTMAYYVYVDLIKAKLLVTLSENTRFWSYGDKQTDKRYGLVAPKL